ncbi:MAG: recombinase family protein [Chloroflexi bacterium]|nr:recombinase family protein [Chloroflexota bacterium]
MCISCKNGGPQEAGIWWRVSTGDQLDLSPKTQISDARALLESQGFVVNDNYVLGADWSSPEIKNCPEYQHLFRLVEQRSIHAIGVYNPDRLAARPADRLFLRAVCERNGVTVVSVHGEIMEGPEGEFLEFAQTWAKFLQVTRAQESSKDGLRDRAKIKGLMPAGRPPFGYEYAKKVDTSGNTVTDHSRVVSSKDWYIVSRIFRRYIEDGLSIRKIAKELRDDGILSPRGREKWDPSSISNMLRNPMYGGKAFGLRHKAVEPSERTGRTYGKSSMTANPRDEWVELGVVVETPVVSWPEFEAIQERLKLNQKFSPRNAKHSYLLRGLIICEEHGVPFHGVHHQGDGEGFVYQCGSYARGKPAKTCKRSIWGPNIERHTWERAQSLLRNPAAIIGEVERRESMKADSEDVLNERLKRVWKQLSDNRQAEANLVELRIREGMSEDIFNRVNAKLKAERTWCGEEVQRLEDQLAAVRRQNLSLEQLQVIAEAVGGKLDGMKPADKRFVLEALDTQVYVSIDGRKQITFSVPEDVQIMLKGSRASLLSPSSDCRTLPFRRPVSGSEPPFETPAANFPCGASP